MNPVEDYIATLETEFRANANPEVAQGQQAYMKDNFVFIGMKAEGRRELQKPFLAKKYMPIKKDALAIVRLLWEKPERDFQLFGQENKLYYLLQ